MKPERNWKGFRESVREQDKTGLGVCVIGACRLFCESEEDKKIRNLKNKFDFLSYSLHSI